MHLAADLQELHAKLARDRIADWAAFQKETEGLVGLARATMKAGNARAR